MIQEEDDAPEGSRYFEIYARRTGRQFLYGSAHRNALPMSLAVVHILRSHPDARAFFFVRTPYEKISEWAGLVDWHTEGWIYNATADHRDHDEQSFAFDVEGGLLLYPVDRHRLEFASRCLRDDIEDGSWCRIVWGPDLLDELKRSPASRANAFRRISETWAVDIGVGSDHLFYTFGPQVGRLSPGFVEEANAAANRDLI